MRFIPRLLSVPENKSFFLFGPRGTGKSTWLNRQLPSGLRIDLLHADEALRFSASPSRLADLVRANPDRKQIIIDEIQRAPGLLPVAHSLIEELRDRRFVFTGSSSRKLKRTGIDFLGGRALLRTMHPFMACELGNYFSIEQALISGLIPVIVDHGGTNDDLRAYTSLYIKEEVQEEGLIRNIGSFARFLDAISFSHAQLLNLSAVARECSVERKTVEGYVSVLEDLLLCFRVSVFSKRAKRTLVNHHKFYLFDPGVFRALRPAGALDRPHEIEGASLEGLVAQHLRSWIAYRNMDEQLYFWRTQRGNEVDFIVYGENNFCAIEVKNSLRVRPEDIKGLAAFSEDYPEASVCLLYRGNERIMTNNILCLPCGAFLSSLDPRRASLKEIIDQAS